MQNFLASTRVNHLRHVTPTRKFLRNLCKHFLLFRFIAHHSTTRNFGFDFLENEKQTGEKNNKALLNK